MAEHRVRPGWWYAPPRQWYAQQVGRLPSVGEIEVVGQVTLPLHYEARLEKHDPQDEGGDNLVLDLVIEPSNGTDNPVREEVPPEVRYEEQTEVRYSGPAEAWYEDIVIVSRTRFPVDRVW
jgi:hypothetical protein